MENNWESKLIQIGIIGGGQLGRMFIQEAISFDVNVHVLDGDINAPCKEIAHSFTHGSILDYHAVFNFGKNKDIITVEIENVNIEALEDLEKMGKKVYPQPHVLRTIKDKGIQKLFYQQNGIPTSPFVLIENKDDLTKKIKNYPAVQKLRTGGYDGKGVFVIKNEAELINAFNNRSILEEYVPFQKELAVIVARNQRNEIVSYPVVECEFNDVANLVEMLFSPADVDQSVEDEAQRIARKVIESLDMIGILAVEFFLTKDNQLLVNEIAPRPHNSGHHTIECNRTSQFEQHCRAILGMPLGATELIQCGAMINLLGEPGFEGQVRYTGLLESMKIDGVHPHLYGKKETKAFRKMGHITISGKNLEIVKEIAHKVKGMVKVIA